MYEPFVSIWLRSVRFDLVDCFADCMTRDCGSVGWQCIRICLESVGGGDASAPAHVGRVSGHRNMRLRTLIDVVIRRVSFNNHTSDCNEKKNKKQNKKVGHTTSIWFKLRCSLKREARKINMS